MGNNLKVFQNFGHYKKNIVIARAYKQPNSFFMSSIFRLPTNSFLPVMMQKFWEKHTFVRNGKFIDAILLFGIAAITEQMRISNSNFHFWMFGCSTMSLIYSFDAYEKY
jgi:hypothetical protein